MTQQCHQGKKTLVQSNTTQTFVPVNTYTAFLMASKYGVSGLRISYSQSAPQQGALWDSVQEAALARLNRRCISQLELLFQLVGSSSGRGHAVWYPSAFYLNKPSHYISVCSEQMWKNLLCRQRSFPVGTRPFHRTSWGIRRSHLWWDDVLICSWTWSNRRREDGWLSILGIWWNNEHTQEHQLPLTDHI